MEKFPSISPLSHLKPDVRARACFYVRRIPEGNKNGERKSPQKMPVPKEDKTESTGGGEKP